MLENKRRVGKQIICACRFHFLNKKNLDFFGDDDDGDDDGDDDAIALQYNDRETKFGAFYVYFQPMSPARTA